MRYHLCCFGHTHNKQFKSDSPRLALWVWVWFSVYGVLVKLCGSMVHTLIGRYTNRGKLCTKILILTWIQKSSGLRKTHILCLR
ncbi:hypothetical protein DMN98_25705 [Vibrio parahaemolyticus]|nr:hypothetical protein [Vibrio parahaemolyticus]